MFLNRIDRYIFKTVFSSFLIVSLIFCILFFIFTYLAQVSNNDTGASNIELIIITIYQLPGILYTLLPACAMVGALMGLSLLANNSEIIVLRSFGRSTAQIAKGVVLVGIIGSIVTMVFGGYIAPVLQKLADSNTVAYNTHDLWLKTPDGFMNISNIDPNEGKAYGIRKFITKDNQVQEVRYAEKAEYVNDATANVFNVSVVTFPNKDVKHIDVKENVYKAIWSNPIPISVAKVITINDNDYLNFTQLTRYMLSNSQAKDSISLKFWQEIFQPLALMVLILLSVPLSIGSTRSSTLILKLLLGAFFGFAFFIINQIFGPIALILHLPTILGAAGPTVIALILLIYLFIKSKET
ncbi:LPS export ABC transporter permease LptG [Francisella philomiragia]|uniref:LPS export ABC transporter permease LptG n=2 Tax=Francisella philomiragia TaxID=28110 RepID=A0ABS1GAW5_9GAMM|nr:LPS export ABC transporter permease LptG [Francisella philomiragia]AJI46649.1 putative permease YjgP/YjgQ family protein [Francisella philomiragia]AJI48543.1 LPS export ABC transporter permease LptG [Francisella philomiragia]AJI55370.1 LPS export ABC transporter permease LptG [Francisella philomiragia]AJI57300.1 LPS export ABC transporter permease LptG [Francisella philomiragia]AJI75829.1 LPS export ABC transporter permease LptG [Francisella philomiragia subsp. philomiragia ATCC 25015]